MISYETIIFWDGVISGTVDSSINTTILTTQVIAVSEPRSATVGFVNAINNLGAPRPIGYGKVEWTANGQPLNAAPFDTVIRVDEVV
jgi:hypothetical protein